MADPVKIVIIGNGFGGIYALKNMHKLFHKKRGVEITLVGERNYFLFTPLLHEVATGGIQPENIIEPIRAVLGCCLDKFYMGKAGLIDTKLRTVLVGEAALPYDYLILSPGAQTNYYGIPGAAEHSFTLKSIEDAVVLKNHIINQMERASHTESSEERKKILTFAVIGGGPTGVELASEIQELIKESFSRYYPPEIVGDTSVVLVQRESELVPQFGPKMRQKSLRILQKEGIKVMLNTAVTAVSSSEVLMKGGALSTETAVWVAGVKPNTLLFDVAMENAPGGQLVVNEYLQLKDYKEIFAIGDVAMFKDAASGVPLPALAQVAEKQAVAVAKNIQLLLSGKTPQAFRYHHLGVLMSLGQWRAVGEISGFTFSGRIAWWVWRTIYLSKLISMRKKIEVVVDWTLNIFSPRDISQY